MKGPEKLYEGNMRKKYLLFAIPLILSAMLSQSYTFVNSMLIGRFLGSEAFAAMAVTAELIEFFNSIFFGYLTGVGIYVSVLFGRNEKEKLLNVIKMNFFITTVFAVSISILCNVFCGQIFDLLNVNDEIYKNAESYFRIYICGLTVFQFNWGFTYISNGMGMTKMPLIASIVSGVFNVSLNYLFLSVLKLGIGFSALATIIGISVVTAFYFITFKNLFKDFGVSSKGIKFNKDDIKLSFDYGLPSMLQQMTMYSCTALVSPLTNTCSTAALSGYSVANKAKNLLLAVYQNSSKANTNLIAQAMGAKKINKIRQGIKIGVQQGLIFFGITLALFMIFARQFTGLFLDPIQDAESFTVSVNIIRFLFPFIFFNVFNNLFHGIFRAVGSGRLMFISTLIYAVAFVVYAYILFAVLPNDFKIYGVYIALSGAYITEVIFATVIFITGRWKTPEYKKIEALQVLGQSKG
ncbi:MAG: MATE family efflux transporter [Ruminococcaceae bacterium]|nr:MATE family efflux transporter [Oscillospiraceae bacterium]